MYKSHKCHYVINLFPLTFSPPPPPLVVTFLYFDVYHLSMQTRTIIKAKGNSYCLPIRKYLLDLYDLKLNDVVEVTITKVKEAPKCKN